MMDGGVLLALLVRQDGRGPDGVEESVWFVPNHPDSSNASNTPPPCSSLTYQKSATARKYVVGVYIMKNSRLLEIRCSSRIMEYCATARSLGVACEGLAAVSGLRKGGLLSVVLLTGTTTSLHCVSMRSSPFARVGFAPRWTPLKGTLEKTGLVKLLGVRL